MGFGKKIGKEAQAIGLAVSLAVAGMSGAARAETPETPQPPPTISEGKGSLDAKQKIATLQEEVRKIKEKIKETTAKIQTVEETIAEKSGKLYVEMYPESRVDSSKVDLPANINKYSVEMLEDFLVQLFTQRQRLVIVEREKVNDLEKMQGKKGLGWMIEGFESESDVAPPSKPGESAKPGESGIDINL